MKTNLLKLTCGLALLGAVFTAKAQSTIINFEDALINHPALGFTTTSVGGAPEFPLVVGLANGDPGNWGMEGSNGPYLMGFWGNSSGQNQGYTGSGDTTYAAIDFVGLTPPRRQR